MSGSQPKALIAVGRGNYLAACFLIEPILSAILE